MSRASSSAQASFATCRTIPSIDVPCTKTVRVCEYRPVTKTVNTVKKEIRHETYTCTVMKCVPKVKEETCTVYVEKKIPYEATRTVCKKVPAEEKVTCCRMVKRCVEKQVPVCEEECAPECPPPCDSGCDKGKKRMFNFGKKCSK